MPNRKFGSPLIGIGSHGSGGANIHPMLIFFIINRHVADAHIKCQRRTGADSEGAGSRVGHEQSERRIQHVIEKGAGHHDPIIKNVGVFDGIPNIRSFHKGDVAAAACVIKTEVFLDVANTHVTKNWQIS